MSPPNTPQMRAALYYARRNRRARVVIQGLTPWTPGLVVAAGEFVQNIGNGYLAITPGVTGAVPPIVDGGSQSDGVVDWEFQNPQVFINYIITPPPTPA
jgi:hypothetical protein